MELPSEESRRAALAVYRRQPEQGEAILTQANLVFQAIQLNIELFRWQRWVWLSRVVRQRKALRVVLCRCVLQSAGAGGAV